MSGDDLAGTYGELAKQFSVSFSPTQSGLRTVGREAEFPLVTATGQAADLRRLWDNLLAQRDLEPQIGPGPLGARELIVGLQGADYSYMLEVGVGTVEVNTRPCTDLFEIERIMEDAVGRLVRAAGRLGWRLLAYGIQPSTAPALQILAPKQRYLSLYRAMGASWLWYTVTASDQVQVSVGRDEMISLLNFGNLMAPVLIALCANSPVHSGALSPFCSAREGQMATIYAQEHRHGMLARPVTDMADFVEALAQSTYLIVRDADLIIPSSQPFADYLRLHGPDYGAFLFHEHYIWNSARLRAAYGTLEIRPACQQPWAEHMAAVALGLGLVEAAEQIQHYIEESLGQDYWTIMQTYHAQAIRFGLAAPQPAPSFLDQIVTLAESGLRKRERGEEVFLQPLFLRLRRRSNPAQRLRITFRNNGLSALLNQTTIRPGATKPSFA